ncbi:MAG: hypothetical protein ABJA74_13705 [Lapillicoccus sp.]
MAKRAARPPTTAPEAAASAGLESDGVDEQGGFAFADCPVCGWRGPGRRSRDRARKDLRHHRADGGHPAVVRDSTS